jgi:hypothetical protein
VIPFTSASACSPIEAEPAPAAADIEDFQVLPVEDELCRDMPLLGELRLLQRRLRRLEIGAGILPVGVEEQRIELGRQIVVVMDVAAGPLRGVVLDDAAIGQPRLVDRPHPGLARARPGAVGIVRNKLQEIEDGADRHVEAPIHVGLAERQAGVSCHRPLARGRVEPDFDPLADAVAEAVPGAGRVRDEKVAVLEKAAEKERQDEVHRISFQMN